MRVTSVFAALAAFAVSASASVIAKRDTVPIALDPYPTDLVTCTNVTFTWTGGIAPYTFRLYKDEGGLYLDRYQDEPSVTWLVDAAEGKGVNIQMYDSTGTNSFYSGPSAFNIKNGTDVSCVRCAGYLQYQYC